MDHDDPARVRLVVRQARGFAGRVRPTRLLDGRRLAGIFERRAAKVHMSIHRLDRHDAEVLLDDGHRPVIMLDLDPQRAGRRSGSFQEDDPVAAFSDAIDEGSRQFDATSRIGCQYRRGAQRTFATRPEGRHGRITVNRAGGRSRQVCQHYLDSLIFVADVVTESGIGPHQLRDFLEIQVDRHEVD